MKPNRRFSLDPDVAEILEDISTGQSSASAYVEELVRDAERAWRTALDHLRQAGWHPNELLAACDALNGWDMLGLVGPRPATWAATELADAARLSGLTAKWEVTDERWTSLCGRIGSDAVEAQALTGLAREFWRMNPRVERLIRG